MSCAPHAWGLATDVIGACVVSLPLAPVVSLTFIMEKRERRRSHKSMMMMMDYLARRFFHENTILSKLSTSSSRTRNRERNLCAIVITFGNAVERDRWRR